LPTVLRVAGARFFYSNEGDPGEARHVHVERGGAVAQIWVHPRAAVAESFGFDRRALFELLRVVDDHRSAIERAWHEHFG
jgi:hypothetical protein